MGWCGLPQEGAALRQLLLAYPVGQEAAVAQPVEAVGWDMQHQTPQEFHGIERQGAQAVTMRVVLVAEGHLAVLQGHETMVGNGHTVGIAGQVLQDVPGVLEGLFGVDHPLAVAQGGKEPLPGLGLGKLPTATRQEQLALAIELLQSCKVQPPKTPREDADGQEEVGTTRHPAGAMSREPAGGQHTMQMRVMTTTVTIP